GGCRTSGAWWKRRSPTRPRTWAPGPGRRETWSGPRAGSGGKQMDHTVTLGLVFSALVVAASVVGSAYVVRDRLDRLGAAFEKHADEDDRRFEAALAALERERQARESAVHETRKLAHDYATQSQVAINGLARQTQAAVQAIAVEVAALKARAG